MASPTLATPELLPSSAPSLSTLIRSGSPSRNACHSLVTRHTPRCHPVSPSRILPAPFLALPTSLCPNPTPAQACPLPWTSASSAPATRPQVPAMSAPASPTPLPLSSPPRNSYPPKSVVPQTPPALYVYPLCSFTVPHPCPCSYHLPCLEGLFPSPPREPYSSLKSQHQCPFLQEAFPDAFREDTASSSSESSRLAISPPGHGWAHVQAISVLGALLSSGNLGKCGVNGE